MLLDRFLEFLYVVLILAVTAFYRIVYNPFAWIAVIAAAFVIGYRLGH